MLVRHSAAALSAPRPSVGRGWAGSYISVQASFHFPGHRCSVYGLTLRNASHEGTSVFCSDSDCVRRSAFALPAERLRYGPVGSVLALIPPLGPRCLGPGPFKHFRSFVYFLRSPTPYSLASVSLQLVLPGGGSDSVLLGLCMFWFF